MDELLIAFRPGMSSEEIGEVGKSYMAAVWRRVYDTMREQLTAMFPEIEDAAYGLYLDQLMPPIFEGLEKAGFVALGEVRENDFIIGGCLNFRDSMEQWGTDANSSRVFWNVIRNERNQPIGTLLTELPHSHLKFDIPAAPQVYVIDVVDKAMIKAEIRRIKEGA
jgi:hypothetical protein